jgi:hypothetical protein
MDTFILQNINNLFTYSVFIWAMSNQYSKKDYVRSLSKNYVINNFCGGIY